MTTQVKTIPREELRPRLLADYQRRQDAARQRAEAEAVEREVERRRQFRQAILSMFHVEITDAEADAMVVELGGAVLAWQDGSYADGYSYGYWRNPTLNLMVPCKGCGELTAGPAIEQVETLAAHFADELHLPTPECQSCWQTREDGRGAVSASSEDEPVQVVSAAESLGQALVAFLAAQGIWPQR